MDLQNHCISNGEHAYSEESIKQWVSELTDFTPHRIDEVVSRLRQQKSCRPLMD